MCARVLEHSIYVHMVWQRRTKGGISYFLSLAGTEDDRFWNSFGAGIASQRWFSNNPRGVIHIDD